MVPVPWNAPVQAASVWSWHPPSSASQQAPTGIGATESVNSVAPPPPPPPMLRATRTTIGTPAGRLGELNRERLPQAGSLSLQDWAPTRLALVAGHAVWIDSTVLMFMLEAQVENSYGPLAAGVK